MDDFKIHFQLQNLDKVSLWGTYPQQSIHWFGLTDGLLWIDVCGQTIYEYTDEACCYFDNHSKYNDYQLSRFMEDFSRTFLCVGVSIPEELYRHIEEFEMQTDDWKKLHINDEDDVFDIFYEKEYCELIQWYFDRSFDSGHLVGGPHIGCFRFNDRIKIMWKSDCELENEQRKETFYQSLSFLQNPRIDMGWNVTDWDKVKAIYAKMKKDILLLHKYKPSN